VAIARLGNVAAIDRGRLLPGNLITTFVIREDGAPLEDRLQDITNPDGLWTHMSLAKPAWVEADDFDVAAALATFYGCPIGRPDDTWA
jgi:hypothetical protein